jgi:hypothetical protein
MITIDQPVDVMHCTCTLQCIGEMQALSNRALLDEGQSWEVYPRVVREAHIEAMTLRYQYPGAKTFPSVVSSEKLKPVSFLFLFLIYNSHRFPKEACVGQKVVAVSCLCSQSR